MIKKDKNIVRNIRYFGSMNKEEYKVLVTLAKRLKISKNELIIRALIKYSEGEGIEK